jgi:hypothetical protein
MVQECEELILDPNLRLEGSIKFKIPSQNPN